MGAKIHVFIALQIGLAFSALTAEAKLKPVSAGEWRERMSSEFTQEICGPEGYFLNCFEMKAAACRASVSFEFSRCAGKIRLPKTIDPFTEGISISYKVGHCVGDSIEKKNHKNKKADERCQKPANWISL